MAALGRQVVSFSTTGSRAAQEFGLPVHLRGIIKRYDAAKIAAVAMVSIQAAAIATGMVIETYTIPQTELSGKLRPANTPDTFRLFASSLRYPLSMFNGKWNGKQSPGATAEIVRGQTKVYEHAFIAPGRFRGRTMPMIYTRKAGEKVPQKHGRYAGQKRQPLTANRGPSVYNMLIGTDNGGNEKWVRLTGRLTDKLKDIFLAEVKRSYEALQ